VAFKNQSEQIIIMTERDNDILEIKRILAEEDQNAVCDKAFQFIQKYPRDEEILILLCNIFESDWHTRHEDMALSFQYVKNPITALSLLKVAFSDFEYCNWNDNYPLQRKCTWALADIGTEEAKKYLLEIEKKANRTIASFATKRLINWNLEQNRKGQMLRSDKMHGFNITLEKYYDAKKNLPENGQRIIGNTLKTTQIKIKDYSTGEHIEVTNEYIVVYQAYNKRIADYAVENQKFGGTDFSYSRMSWIKPNFLWMMYRCGWAEKENQERVLAIWVKKETFEEILRNATFTSFQPNYFETESVWRKTLENKKVRLQWDPDHNCLGDKLERRAIQLGLKDEILEKFGKEQIECIMDITDFVKEQKAHIDNNRIDKLLIPRERIIEFIDDELKKQIGIEN
jgi:hypothetical protein